MKPTRISTIPCDCYVTTRLPLLHTPMVAEAWTSCVCDLVYMCVCVCQFSVSLCVRALKGKWSYLSSPKLVEIAACGSSSAWELTLESEGLGNWVFQCNVHPWFFWTSALYMSINYLLTYIIHGRQAWHWSAWGYDSSGLLVCVLFTGKKGTGSLVLVNERWAQSWSRCTGSQPAGDFKPSTWR